MHRLVPFLWLETTGLSHERDMRSYSKPHAFPTYGCTQNMCRKTHYVNEILKTRPGEHMKSSLEIDPDAAHVHWRKHVRQSCSYGWVFQLWHPTEWFSQILVQIVKSNDLPTSDTAPAAVPLNTVWAEALRRSLCLWHANLTCWSLWLKPNIKRTRAGQIEFSYLADWQMATL